MIEIWAAVTGAAVSAAAMSVSGQSRRNHDARDAVIRLTSAVEHIATQLEVMHDDIKDVQKETFFRLTAVENRVTRLEAQA